MCFQEHSTTVRLVLGVHDGATQTARIRRRSQILLSERIRKLLKFAIRLPIGERLVRALREDSKRYHQKRFFSRKLLLKRIALL